MTDALQWVFSVISTAVSWLSSWNFLGVSFLVFLIAFAVIGIILDNVF